MYWYRLQIKWEIKKNGKGDIHAETQDKHADNREAVGSAVFSEV
jgi:hypothetical protein